MLHDETNMLPCFFVKIVTSNCHFFTLDLQFVKVYAKFTEYMSKVIFCYGRESQN